MNRPSHLAALIAEQLEAQFPGASVDLINAAADLEARNRLSLRQQPMNAYNNVIQIATWRDEPWRDEP